jgi:hypothetical protein
VAQDGVGEGRSGVERADSDVCVHDRGELVFDESFGEVPGRSGSFFLPKLVVLCSNIEAEVEYPGGRSSTSNPSGFSSVVEHRIANPVVAGSNPAAHSFFAIFFSSTRARAN